MANYVTNDRGEDVVAVGQDSSIERARAAWPALIETINVLHRRSEGEPGRCVDKAIDLVRAVGVQDSVLTRAIIAASEYRNERQGSVTHLALGFYAGTRTE